MQMATNFYKAKHFYPGMQIAYVPDHAKDDENHPDIEFGFVTSVRKNGCFCRYWIKGSPGELRTTCNSELTPKCNLYYCNCTVSKKVIDQILLNLKHSER